jgi:hypothetical protein
MFMLPFQREILAIRSREPQGSTDRLSQCLICGSFMWSLDGEESSSCRCYSSFEYRRVSMATAAA